VNVVASSTPLDGPRPPLERSAQPPCVADHGARRMRVREIQNTDLFELAALLAEGFPKRRLEHWRAALRLLGKRPTVDGFPRYGYCLEDEGRLEGALLLLTATIDGVTRSNLSSWYVRPRYRLLATLMHQCAVRTGGSIYLNLSPAAHTLRSIEALGFRPYTAGTLLVDATSSVKIGDSIVRSLTPDLASTLAIDVRRWVQAHCRYGCDALLLEDKEGPMIALYRIKWLKRSIPAARFVAGDPARLAASSGPLMRALFPRGIPLALIDAPLLYTPARGIRHFPNRARRYASSSGAPPAPGDLRETEVALFGA
jgi:hypothetical protein